MARIGRAWNKQQFSPCQVCKESTLEPNLFFGETVCGRCCSELKKIAKQEPCMSRSALIYYILQQARFLRKKSFDQEPRFFHKLNLEELNELAHWFIQISWTNLLELK